MGEMVYLSCLSVIDEHHSPRPEKRGGGSVGGRDLGNRWKAEDAA